jgi:hypothetical protein
MNTYVNKIRLHHQSGFTTRTHGIVVAYFRTQSTKILPFGYESTKD